MDPEQSKKIIKVIPPKVEEYQENRVQLQFGNKTAM